MNKYITYNESKGVVGEFDAPTPFGEQYELLWPEKVNTKLINRFIIRMLKKYDQDLPDYTTVKSEWMDFIKQ